MEDTKRKIEIMKAYAEGKQIQVSCCGYDLWRDCEFEPDWDWVSYDYRVKPEEKYRPYENYHEMVDDFCERFRVSFPKYIMPKIWLKSNATDYLFMISNFSGSEDSRKILATYYKNYTYLDGSPVGKKVEE